MMDHNKLLALWNTDDEEVGDYDDGFKAGFKGRPNDDTKSAAWQRGWAAAQE